MDIQRNIPRNPKIFLDKELSSKSWPRFLRKLVRGSSVSNILLWWPRRYTFRFSLRAVTMICVPLGVLQAPQTTVGFLLRRSLQFSF